MPDIASKLLARLRMMNQRAFYVSPHPSTAVALPDWCKMLFHAARRAMSRDIEDGRPVPPSVMLGKLTNEASFDAILNS